VSDEFEPLIFAPRGAVLTAAGRRGHAVVAFKDLLDFSLKLRPVLSMHKRMAFVTTSVSHSLACVVLNKFYGRDISHLHVVHGEADEQSYNHKRRLNNTGVFFIAASPFIATRLRANGVRADRIRVIEDFLSDSQVRTAPKREQFSKDGVRKLIVISRVDPNKRVDLLLDALDREPALRRLSVRVYGVGSDLEKLRTRGARRNPNVIFAGFSETVNRPLAASDLLVHLCPEEPFGLSAVEAMAAGVPALVPNTGGAAGVVENDVSGFHFEANKPEALAARLVGLSRAEASLLNRVVAGGRAALESRFSAAARAEDYRRLLNEPSFV
jgi:glycosyltransferase involved in cell wall biosynthesis